MSPTLVFPSPFGSRDLPPYGHADWKRLQPVLLRRSLALSSAMALSAGLILGLVLQRAAVQEISPEHKVHYIPGYTPPPPSIPGYIEAKGNVTNATDGTIVAKPPDAPDIVDPGPITNPGPFDPTATLPIGIIGDTNQRAVEGIPERPDPKVVTVVDELPVSVHAPKPEYPELARQAGVEGMVTLQILVSREGKVAEVILLKSAPMFDDAAEKAIRQWRFRPAILNNQPVAAWVVIPVRFLLHEE